MVFFFFFFFFFLHKRISGKWLEILLEELYTKAIFRQSHNLVLTTIIKSIQEFFSPLNQINKQVINNIQNKLLRRNFKNKIIN